MIRLRCYGVRLAGRGRLPVRSTGSGHRLETDLERSPRCRGLPSRRVAGRLEKCVPSLRSVNCSIGFNGKKWNLVVPAPGNPCSTNVPAGARSRRLGLLTSDRVNGRAAIKDAAASASCVCRSNRCSPGWKIPGPRSCCCSSV